MTYAAYNEWGEILSGVSPRENGKKSETSIGNFVEKDTDEVAIRRKDFLLMRNNCVFVDWKKWNRRRLLKVTAET